MRLLCAYKPFLFTSDKQKAAVATEHGSCRDLEGATFTGNVFSFLAFLSHIGHTVSENLTAVSVSSCPNFLVASKPSKL